MPENPKSEIRNPKSRGFTLVELLVVIATIGVLVALLLPAVQAAREAARRIQCANHLKQLSLAMHEHHDAFNRFPSGGWGWNLVGDPDRGTGLKQPGSWCYSILPYMEQQALYDIGKGLADTPKAAASPKRLSMPVPGFYCPSRRDAKAYPCANPDPNNSDPSPTGGRTDYAANACYTGYPFGLSGPNSVAAGDTMTANNTWPNLPASHGVNGISFLRSEISLAQVRDGSSNTLMLGEKYLRPEVYETGTDYADNETMYSGFNNDNHRSSETQFPPQQDTLGYSVYDLFGSAHSGIYQAAFCDGSVHGIQYDIDLETHRRLGNRKDGQVVDTSGL